MKENLYRLLSQAKELFTLKEYPDENRWEGLLYPTPESGIYPYRSPALGVYSLVKPVAESMGAWEFFACIHSIDDSGCSIFGPAESKEKALGRMSKFIEFLKLLDYACPTKEELAQFCQDNGVAANYW